MMAYQSGIVPNFKPDVPSVILFHYRISILYQFILSLFILA